MNTAAESAPQPAIAAAEGDAARAGNQTRRAWATRRRRRRIAEVALTLAGPVLLIAIWEALARLNAIDTRFWPAPSSLVDTFWQLLTEDDLLGDIQLSTIRIVGGFLIGSIPGVALGLAMGLYWPIRVFMMPLATAIYALPKIAMLPLVIIIFGTGESAKLAVVAVSIFFLVVLSTMGGVLAIDRLYTDVARNLGASRWQMFQTVALPGALPAIFTGLRLALGFALIVIVGTEFLSSRQGGVGDLIWQSWQTLAIKKMFVGLVITGIMGWLLTLVLDVIERFAIPWKPTE